MAGIVYRAVLDVRFGQVVHVNERHSTCVETEQEEVPHEGQAGTVIRFQAYQPGNNMFADSPFPSLVDVGVDFAERVDLFGMAMAYRFVVHGSEDAHLEGQQVVCQSLVQKIILVALDKSQVQFTGRVRSESRRVTPRHAGSWLPCRGRRSP